MKRILLILSASVLLFGCGNNWMDINTDPNNPTDVPISLLLPTAELNATRVLCAGEVGSNGAGIGQDLGVYTHQLSTREEANEYGIGGSAYYLTSSWNWMYTSTLQNIDVIIKKANAQQAPYYSGIAKIIKAYLYSQYVDLFGDVPFSEANRKADGIFYPKFDKGADIYPQLFTMLDDGIADLGKAAGTVAPTTDDIIFGGKATKWINTANTIKLKLYNQIRLVDPSVGTKIAALLASGNLISSTEDGFMYPFTKLRTPDERNPAYPETYEATQKTVCMSPWFFEILKGINPLFSGVVDPRIPYYFYNQLSSTMTSRDGHSFEYRYGGFTSLYFGSHGPDRDGSQDASQTVYGIYPCGGRYDEGDHIKVNASSGTGAAPFRFLTYADRLFIEAELIQAGVITGDAHAKLSDAMNEAFKLVDYVATKANGSQTIPTLYNSTKGNAYITKILALFDAGDANKKMEIIMTQKWISSFGGNYVDQYNDYRRTGYPVLFDPNNTTMAPGGYVTPPAGGDPDRTLPPVRVSCSKLFPLSLPWPADELNVNKQAPAQKTDPSKYPVFWDK